MANLTVRKARFLYFSAFLMLTSNQYTHVTGRGKRRVKVKVGFAKNKDIVFGRELIVYS